RLGAVPVDALAGDAMPVEEVGESVGAVLRAREDERLRYVVPLEERQEQWALQLLRDGVDRVRDPDRRCRLALEVHGDGIPEHLARQPDDRRGHRRREEERLPSRRQVAEDAADVRQEAHIEHPVRLVENEDLQVLELRVRLAEVVEEPARRRDDHVDRAAERVLLRTHAEAGEGHEIATSPCPANRGSADGAASVPAAQGRAPYHCTRTMKGANEGARYALSRCSRTSL